AKTQAAGAAEEGQGADAPSGAGRRAAGGVHRRIARRSEGGGPGVTAGLYVHVPFCLTRCGYCDFNAYEGLGHLSGRYVDALAREAALVAREWAGEEFRSVFFGGGTPTTLGSEQLRQVLAVCKRAFHIANDAEITVEANPDTVDETMPAALLDAGFTRLSMGAQSFDESV